MKMRVKKLLRGILLAVLIIGLSISVFFYFQHRIQVERYSIGRYIEFEEFSVFVKDIEKYNFERNRLNFPDWVLNDNLPNKMRNAILKLDYFYSFPFHVDNDTLKYEVNCEVIFNEEVIDAKSVEDLIREKLTIAMYNNNSNSYTKITSSKISVESNKNIILYKYVANLQENDSSGIKIMDIENTEDESSPVL